MGIGEVEDLESLHCELGVVGGFDYRNGVWNESF